MKNDLVLLFRRLTYGVYVVGITHNNKNNAFTAAWIMQVSYSPLLLALGINPNHSSYKMLIQSGAFSVNVLSSKNRDLARHFGQPATVDKLAGVKWHPSKSDTPILDDAIAWFDCKYSHECPAGDHVIIFGRVMDGAILDTGSLPMNYRDTCNMDESSKLYPDDFYER